MEGSQEDKFENPFATIKKISPELQALDSVPLTGSSPPFPWEELALRLSQTFERENLHIEPGPCEWRSKDEILEGIGSRSLCLKFSIPAMRGEASLIASEQDIAL